MVKHPIREVAIHGFPTPFRGVRDTREVQRGAAAKGRHSFRATIK
jgi:hypothetical protein